MFFSGRDVIADVVFKRGSEDHHLNYRGFYTVVLERDKEVVSVATVRIVNLLGSGEVGSAFSYSAIDTWTNHLILTR